MKIDLWLWELFALRVLNRDWNVLHAKMKHQFLIEFVQRIILCRWFLCSHVHTQSQRQTIKATNTFTPSQDDVRTTRWASECVCVCVCAAIAQWTSRYKENKEQEKQERVSDISCACLKWSRSHKRSHVRKEFLWLMAMWLTNSNCLSCNGIDCIIVVFF